jgi:hypothetical protein
MESNIKIDIRELRFGGVDWIHTAVTGFCKLGNKPPGSIKVEVS